MSSPGHSRVSDCHPCGWEEEPLSCFHHKFFIQFLTRQKTRIPEGSGLIYSKCFRKEMDQWSSWNPHSWRHMWFLQLSLLFLANILRKDSENSRTTQCPKIVEDKNKDLVHTSWLRQFLNGFSGYVWTTLALMALFMILDLFTVFSSSGFYILIQLVLSPFQVLKLSWYFLRITSCCHWHPCHLPLLGLSLLSCLTSRPLQLLSTF